jgi:hypothetical protein
MRPWLLPCALLTMAMGLASGCGGGTTSSPSPDPDVAAAKKDLLLAYRVANKARDQGLRCSTGGSLKCHHPSWYPEDRVLVTEVGSDLLHRLSIGLTPSIDQVVNPRATYIVSDKTRRKSLVLAQKTDSGTVLVLHGSPSGATFSQVAASDVNDGPQHQRHETKATTRARNQRADRPPISSSYPSSSPCGSLSFDKPPRNADDVRVAGGNCEQAAALVRRTHEQCAYSVCDTGDYRCDEHDIATGVLSVYCRDRETKVTWTSSGVN